MNNKNLPRDRARESYSRQLWKSLNLGHVSVGTIYIIEYGMQ